MSSKVKYDGMGRSVCEDFNAKDWQGMWCQAALDGRPCSRNNGGVGGCVMQKLAKEQKSTSKISR